MPPYILFFDAYSTNKLGFYLVSITAIRVPMVKKKIVIIYNILNI